MQYTEPASSCGNSNGRIQLFLTGGFGPYTYSLNNFTYQNSNVFNGLNAGIYMGYVKDSRGCVGSLSLIEVGPSCPSIANKGNQQIPIPLKETKTVSTGSILTIQAYPNPSATAFTVKITGAAQEKTTLILTDIMGRKILQEDLAGKQLYCFGNNVEAGIYLLQVVQGDRKQSLKLIKE